MNIDWALLYLISEWTIRLIMLVYVPQRRNPAAARTWLLLIFVQPWVGLILYGWFGRAYLPERRIKMQEVVSRLIRTAGEKFFGRFATHPEMPERFLQTVTLAKNLGDFPIVGGNRVELLSDYAGAIDRLVDDIAAAAHHVHLLYYIFADDATGRKVADAVIAATKRGVTCRVLVDSLGSRVFGRSLGPELRAAGVEVHELLPARLFRRNESRLDLRNHRKIAVIDGKVGYVGSQNLVNADFKEGIIYEEMVARVRGPAVAQLQAVFLSDRFFETHDEKEYPELFPEPDASGPVAAQVLPSGPGYPMSNNRRLFTSLVNAAQKRVVITTPYFIPDDSLIDAMTTAVLRGVEVHLVASRKADQLLVGLAQRSFYKELLEGGVQIHLCREKFLHAKHMSVDDEVAVVGSSNMDLRSFLLNAEISLIVYDAKVAGDLRAAQDRYFAASDLLTLEEWRNRPWPAKVTQNMARLVDSVL